VSSSFRDEISVLRKSGAWGHPTNLRKLWICVLWLCANRSVALYVNFSTPSDLAANLVLVGYILCLARKLRSLCFCLNKSPVFHEVWTIQRFRFRVAVVRCA